MSECVPLPVLLSCPPFLPVPSFPPPPPQGLKYLDSRAVAVLIKELGKNNLSHRARQLFDLVR